MIIGLTIGKRVWVKVPYYMMNPSSNIHFLSFNFINLNIFSFSSQPYSRLYISIYIFKKTDFNVYVDSRKA